MKKIPAKKIEELHELLHFLHVSELKELCENLELSCLGLKKILIERIIFFLETGKSSLSGSFPQISKGKNSPLSPNAKILFGSYKNDLKTRLFFKKLIGEHFHFTAFGQDWIKKRWMAGDPPTYSEFARYWEKEYQRRKLSKAQPKKEWAYINFIQKYIEKKPNASREEITKAWKLERESKLKDAKAILKEMLDA